MSAIISIRIVRKILFYIILFFLYCFPLNFSVSIISISHFSGFCFFSVLSSIKEQKLKVILFRLMYELTKNSIILTIILCSTRTGQTIFVVTGRKSLSNLLLLRQIQLSIVTVTALLVLQHCLTTAFYNNSAVNHYDHILLKLQFS